MPASTSPVATFGRVWARAVGDFLIPAFCIQCAAPATAPGQAFFCAACWQRWPTLRGPTCRGCGRPRDAQIGYAAGPDFICAGCSRGKRAVRFTWAAAPYDETASLAIRAFKYQRWDTLVDLLGPKLAAAAAKREDLRAYDAVVPVPLHWRRSWWRGFNQAALLAEHVARVPGAPPLEALLRRTRYTTPQSRLKGRERERNLTGAFAVRPGAMIAGRTLLLIDDVSTTGTTLKECARTLRRAGAAEVDALTLAVAGTVQK